VRVYFKYLIFLILIFADIIQVSGSSTTSWKDALKNKSGTIVIYYYDSENFITDVGESGKINGIEYELIKEFVKYLNNKHDLNLKIEFKKASTFSDLYNKIKNGKTGEFGACSFSITEARRKEINFSPKYLPDIEVLISSYNLPLVTDTGKFWNAFSKATALTIANSTFDQNLIRLKSLYPAIKIKEEKAASIIRDRISTEQNIFSYIELPTYFASIKSGYQLKRQPLFKVERNGYALIYPKSSDWKDPLEQFFSNEQTKTFINNLIKKYFGDDVKDLLWNIKDESSLSSKEIVLLNKEKEIQNLELEKKKVEIERKNILYQSFLLGFVFVSGFGFLLFKANHTKKKANKILTEQKKEIEGKNVELIAQKEKIEQMNSALNIAFDDITIKNKEITDSINYAKRIQNALLPQQDVLGNHFSESFVLYKPKDIVSGDFYWFTQVNKHFVLSLADCTGHGVPGAFMSAIGHDLLNQIIRDSQITSSADALEELNVRINKLLNKQGRSEEINDGMDMALCAFDLETEELMYAGANRPLLFVRNSELQEFKPNKHSLGGQTYDSKKFTNHSIKLMKGDLIYVFSDGFADQFGGPSGKKFKYSRLKDLIVNSIHLPLSEQKEFLETSFDNWKGSHEQIDDVCIIGLRV